VARHSPSRDMSGNNVTKALGEETIDALPDDPTTYARIMGNLAGRSVTGDELPISVNGMPGAPMPSKENIKLVRVNRNIFSAQYENTYGGGIEVFTSGNVKRI